MAKLSSKNKILIASILVGVLVIGAIVSLVIVLAATQQNVSTSVKVSYIVDGVGAKVSANYYVVNPTNGAVATSVSLTNTTEGEELEFGVSESETTKSLEPEADEEVSLSSTNSKIVYEYKFTNTTVAPFTVMLSDYPGYTDQAEVDNMTVTYKSSAVKLSNFTADFTDTTLKTQLVLEKDQTIYIYIAARVSNLSAGANYNGNIEWMLNYVEETSLSTLTLDNGTGTTSIKYIANSEVQLPHLATIPENGVMVFGGYENASNVQVYDATGSSLSAESTASEVTYTAEWIDAYEVTGTELTGLTTDGQALETLTIPSVVETIGTNALSNVNATTINIPSSVTTIGESAFEGNTTVKEVIIEEANTATAAYADGTGLATIGNRAFSGCTNLATIIIPRGLKIIGYQAFSSCQALKEITIPESVVSIGYQSFHGTISLEKVYYNAKEAISDEYCSIFDNAGYHEYEEELKLEIIIGSKVNVIPAYFCAGSSYADIEPHVKKITFSENSECETIGEYAFAGCVTIEELIIPEGVTSIGVGALQNMTNITKLVLPKTVTYLENGALTGCDNLTNLECSADAIPEGVNNYEGEPCYSGLDALFGCVYDSENWVYNELSAPDSINIKLNGGTALKYGCFAGESFEDLDIPYSVTSIGDYAFYNCINLTSITISYNITSMGHGVFSSCDSLETVYFEGLLAEWNTLTASKDLFNGVTHDVNVVVNDEPG